MAISTMNSEGLGSDSPEVIKKLNEATRIVLNVGNNVNQIARRLNRKALQRQNSSELSMTESEDLLRWIFESLKKLESDILSIAGWPSQCCSS